MRRAFLAVIATTLCGNAPAFASAGCVSAGTSATLTGVVDIKHRHGAAGRQDSAYAVLHVDRPVCISDAADDRSSRSTRTIGLAAPNAQPVGAVETRVSKLALRAVTAHGKLVDTNGGGPYLFYETISAR